MARTDDIPAYIIAPDPAAPLSSLVIEARPGTPVDPAALLEWMFASLATVACPFARWR